MPSAMQKRTALATLIEGAAYGDESGGPDKKFFIMVGLLASVQHWLSFSNHWNSVRGKLPPLHMTSLEGYKDGFEVLKRNDRRKNILLDRFAEVFECHTPVKYTAILRMDDFNEIIRPMIDGWGKSAFKTSRERKALLHPYTITVVALCLDMLNDFEKMFGNGGKLDFFFENHQQCGPVFGPYFRGLIRNIAAESKRDDSLVGHFTFFEKNELDRFAPGQAADMFVNHKFHKHEKAKNDVLKIRRMDRLQAAGINKNVPLDRKALLDYRELLSKSFE